MQVLVLEKRNFYSESQPGEDDVDFPSHIVWTTVWTHCMNNFEFRKKISLLLDSMGGQTQIPKYLVESF